MLDEEVGASYRGVEHSRCSFAIHSQVWYRSIKVTALVCDWHDSIFTNERALL
jgi:hypothetical protein